MSSSALNPPSANHAGEATPDAVLRHSSECVSATPGRGGTTARPESADGRELDRPISLGGQPGSVRTLPADPYPLRWGRAHGRMTPGACPSGCVGTPATEATASVQPPTHVAWHRLAHVDRLSEPTGRLPDICVLDIDRHTVRECRHYSQNK